MAILPVTARLASSALENDTATSRIRRGAGSDPSLRLKSVVCRCFPEHARIIAIPRQADAVFAISWRLNDPARPDKRSKTIRLTLSADLLDQYGLASERDRKAAELRIGSALLKELESFDADPGHAPGEAPPIVSWVVASE